MRPLFLLYFLFIGLKVQAQQSGTSTNELSLSQGISSPSKTHVSLFSNGFNKENPVATSYQTGYRTTAALDGSDSTSFGIDAGVGDGQYGVSIGAYSNGCDGCEGYVRGSLSAIWGSFGLGFGVQDGLYTMGLLVNPNGLHRVGVILELEDLNGSDNNGVGYNRSAFGLGYSLVIPQFTFSFDLAKQTYSNISRFDDAILMSPAVAIRVDIFSVSLSYDLYLNDTANAFNDQVWIGVAANITSEIQVAFYGEYVDRWTLMGSYYF